MRRIAVERARALGFDDEQASDVAIVASELATNILKHAGKGVMLVGAPADGALEIVALDRGPGIADVSRALGDGYSTRGTLGGGLGAVTRLAAQFDIWSDASGTAIVVRLGAAVATRLGAIRVARVGEDACGDAWHVRSDAATAALLLIDGLGHGADAAQAAEAAVAAFSASAAQDAATLLADVDDALRRTRGGAAAVAVVLDDALHYCGIGNISGRLVGGGCSRGLVSNNGIVGGSHRHAQSFVYEIGDAVLLVMHSDGLQTRWDLDAYPGLRQRSPTLIAAVLYRDFARGHDDVAVLVFALRSGDRP